MRTSETKSADQCQEISTIKKSEYSPFLSVFSFAMPIVEKGHILAHGLESAKLDVAQGHKYSSYHLIKW